MLRGIPVCLLHDHELFTIRNCILPSDHHFTYSRHDRPLGQEYRTENSTLQPCAKRTSPFCSLSTSPVLVLPHPLPVLLLHSCFRYPIATLHSEEPSTRRAGQATTSTGISLKMAPFSSPSLGVSQDLHHAIKGTYTPSSTVR